MSWYNPPAFESRKGSLTLMADYANYSSGVLNSTWHKNREAEPKDYDISKSKIRNMHLSTYERMTNSKDLATPESTYQDHYSQHVLRPMYSELDRDRPMVTVDTVKHTYIDRDTGDAEEGIAAVLPRYNPNYRKEYLKTRAHAGFDPFEPEPPIPPDFEDKSAAYRKCRSQFTDTDDYRRPGWNTWLDESGIYANTHFKREVFVPRNPIPLHYTQPLN